MNATARLRTTTGLLGVLFSALFSSGLQACDGPPPPQVTILPTKIKYSYLDVDGNVAPAAGPTEVVLFDIDDPSGASNPPYYYCGDPAASPTNCFDADTNTAILEIPAGAEVTFGSFQYQPLATPPHAGTMNGDLDSVQAMLARISSSNNGRSISINEIVNRASGAAFNTGSGIKPRLVIDWAGLDPSAPDYIPPPADSYKMIVNSGYQLSPPATEWNGSWDATKERWYFPVNNFEGQANDVVRLVEKHMNSDGGTEPWIAHDPRGANLGVVHLWAMVGGFLSADNGRIGLKDPTGIESTWNFDLPPNLFTDPLPAGFSHASFAGRSDKGVGAPGNTQLEASVFTQDYTYLTPSEPGVYAVRNDMMLIWSYGSEIGSPPWSWRAGLYYAGYIDLQPMNVTLASAEGTAFVNNLNSLRSQLRCIPGDDDVADPNFHDCVWDDSFNVASAVSSLSGGQPKNLIKALGISAANADLADYSNLNLTVPSFTPPFIPSGFSAATFVFSGTFPQTTAGNGGTPGKAVIVVRDVKPPPYVRFEASQQEPGNSALLGSGADEGVILGGETGRLLKDSLGTKTKLDVVVFDDNPGQIAFGLRNSAAMLNAGGADVSGSLGAFTTLVTDDALVTPPRVQIWYAVQKAGYSFQAGKYVRTGAESMVAADLDLLAGVRHSQLGGDSQLIPDPTFRYYPFREASTTPGVPGDIKEYEPYEYRLLEKDDEGLGVVMRFQIDLADMREPLGLHFGEGSEELDPDATPPIDYPGYSPFMNRLVVRVADGRLLSAAGATTIIPTPADAKWAGYLQGNYSPYFTEAVDHEGGFLYATEVFPNNRDIPTLLDVAGAMVPPDPLPDLKTAAQALGFDTTKFGQGLGIQVTDVIPPTVLLMVKDTKYDRTVFFGNPFLGDMSQAALENAMAGADVLDPNPQVLVDRTITAADDRALVDPNDVRLYPPEGAEVSIPYCSAVGESDCLILPDGGLGGKVWTFTFDKGGTDLQDYEDQLSQQQFQAFHPTNYFASNQVLTATCDDTSFSPICRAAEPDGLWVDEDTRLVFRVLVRDNLNAYLTSTATSSVDDFQNIEISGASNPHIGTRNPEILDVRLVDSASGYGAGMSLSDGGSNELKDSWPTYSFRNPNRQDNGGGLDVLSEDAYMEVEYTDRAGNTTVLHVDFFVIENTMRILSLREERQRTSN